VRRVSVRRSGQSVEGAFVAAILQKPFSIDELLRSIERTIDRKGHAR
jgi:hypothetical protein